MAAGMYRYTEDDRALVFELLQRGLPGLEVARRTGVDRCAIRRWAKVAGMTMRKGPVGGMVNPRLPRVIEGDYLECGRLTASGRGVIAMRLYEKLAPARIAAELGVARSTVTREIARNTIDGVYAVGAAQKATDENRSRPQPRKLDRPEHARLREEVLTGLRGHWSPQQIHGELAARFPDDKAMRISHESIYQALYVQGRGSLRQELGREKALRSGRTTRIPASKLAPRPRGKSWVGDATITARPAEAADRAVPGHWEGDLIIGKNSASAVITLVERATRYVMLAPLPGRRDATTVTDALIAMMSTLPAHLVKTLTWDQGAELADHARFTLATNCTVYFCDPHSPWQRGSNENTNGLLREFLPRGTDLNAVTPERLAEIERLLNTRPRATLGFANPARKLAELLDVALTV